MPKIAIVYHTGYGHTRVIAESVSRGAAAAGAEVALVSVDELPGAGPDAGGRWGELTDADAIVFGSPTYMGSVSAPFKAFMDASSTVWVTQGWRDKLGAGFTNAGGLSGDKLNTLTTLCIFAAQHSMVWVSQGIFPDGEGHNRMGSWLGLMSQADNAPPEETPPAEDHATAEKFGARVAEAAARWTRGHEPTD